MKRLILATTLPLLLIPALASAKKVEISSISANSTLTDKEKGVVYEAANMLNDNAADMWIEGEGSAGLGKYVGVKFDSDVEVAKVRIWPGCFIDADFWKRHNRVKDIEFKFPDFTSQRVTLKDSMEPQWVEFDEPKKLNNVKIYLRAVYTGTTWNDTPITKLEFYDTEGLVSPIEGLTAKASSEYKDEDNAYAASKAVDGWMDSHWVEGGDSGKGESLDIDLGGTHAVRKFGISTGFDATDSFFEGANRASKVTLAFSDGTTKSFDLADKQGLQVFDVEAKASSVKVTIDSVVKGKTNNDLYIGEVRFWK